MKVRMLRNQKGSENGIDVNEYKNGETYDLPQSLIDVFIHEGWAELIEEKTVESLEKKIVEVKEKQIIRKRSKK